MIWRRAFLFPLRAAATREKKMTERESVESAITMRMMDGGGKAPHDGQRRGKGMIQ